MTHIIFNLTANLIYISARVFEDTIYYSFKIALFALDPHAGRRRSRRYGLGTPGGQSW